MVARNSLFLPRILLIDSPEEFVGNSRVVGIQKVGIEVEFEAAVSSESGAKATPNLFGFLHEFFLTVDVVVFENT